LFNLVAAYAQSGDENALQRGLVDFALLETLAAGLPQFYEGTEDTGKVNKSLDNKGGRLAVLHDNERVLTKAHNQSLGAMTNEELVNNALLGMHISDNPNLYNGGYYKQQADDFARVVNGSGGFNTSTIEEKLDDVKKAIIKKPVTDYNFEKATDTAIIISKRVTKGLMTREQKIKKRL
jgi:hypothetical protein